MRQTSADYPACISPLIADKNNSTKNADQNEQRQSIRGRAGNKD
jgi:hypothetical protein